MAPSFIGVEAHGVSLEKSGVVAGCFVDNPDVFVSSIVAKSTARVLVDRDKAQGGRWDNIR